MSNNIKIDSQISSQNIPLKIDYFLQKLLSYLAETLEDTVGLEDASGLISVVGNLMGEEINQYYHQVFKNQNLTPEQVGAIMVDLKRRIDGDFYLIEVDEEKIVLGNRRCPLSHLVEGHVSLCMMTSSVFGVIASQNLGYAKVILEQTIAKGDQGCRVIVYYKPTAAANLASGKEYYRI